MGKVPEVLRQIARLEASVFGGTKQTVTRYWDDNEVSDVHILEAVNSPYGGLTSVATVGLSDYSIRLTVDGKELRTELVGACESSTTAFPNILSTCAFCIINDGHHCVPGAVFRDVVTMYEPTSPMKHIMAVPPFSWEKELETLDFPDKIVEWLQIVPISEAEYRYALENGSDALETLLEEKQADVSNLYRESVV